MARCHVFDHGRHRDRRIFRKEETSAVLKRVPLPRRSYVVGPQSPRHLQGIGAVYSEGLLLSRRDCSYRCADSKSRYVFYLQSFYFCSNPSELIFLLLSGINERDICNILKFDEHLLRGRLDKLVGERFVICHTEMAVTGKKPHYESFWYINFQVLSMKLFLSVI